jgi:hypothetical protein
MQIVRWTSSISLLVLCIFLIPLSTSAQVNRNSSLPSTKKAKHTTLIWVRVSPANEEFRVWMPESPQTGTERLVIDKQPVTVTYYGLDQGGTDYAILSVSGLENKNAYLAHMLMLNLYGKSIPKALIDKSDKNEASVKATLQRNIVLNGYLGHEYKIEARNRTGVWRFYSVGKKFYVIAASTARNEKLLLSRFLESFALGATTSATNSNSAQTQLNVKAQQPPPPSTGTWFVIVQTFAKAERSKANKQLGILRSLGYNVHLVETDDYPNLRRGFLAVAIGPQSKRATEHALIKVRSVAPEAYVKSGW